MPNTVTTKIRVDSRDATRALGDLGGAIRNNVALGTLFGNALSGGIDAAMGGLGKLAGAFGENVGPS